MIATGWYVIIVLGLSGFGYEGVLYLGHLDRSV